MQMLWKPIMAAITETVSVPLPQLNHRSIPLIKGDKVLFTYSAEGVIITAALAAATEVLSLKNFSTKSSFFKRLNFYVIGVLLDKPRIIPRL
jgi:hypothetical protein